MLHLSIVKEVVAMVNNVTFVQSNCFRGYLYIFKNIYK